MTPLRPTQSWQKSRYQFDIIISTQIHELVDLSRWASIRIGSIRSETDILAAMYTWQPGPVCLSKWIDFLASKVYRKWKQLVASF